MPHGPILVYMDHNEAVEPGEPVTVADVTYCASLLRVNPAALLEWVVKHVGFRS